MESENVEQQRFLTDFDSSEYLKMYYGAECGSVSNEHWLPFILPKLHETFSEGAVQGDTLIDFGTGPSIYHLLSACESFKTIIATDISDMNRREIEKWLKNEPGAFAWSPVVKMVCELEGDSTKWMEKEHKLRRIIKQVQKCDVLKANPLDPVTPPPADCVMSIRCLESACKDVKSYCEVLKMFRTILKPGGYLVIASGLHGSFYYVGQSIFPCLYIRQEDVEKAFIDAGFEIVKMEVKQKTDLSTNHISDYYASYFVLGRRPVEY
ncbi:nicotinamide N-methyltransferase-like [Lissotriton helveticus]